MSWGIILHGGANGIDPTEADARRAACLRALELGTRILAIGGSAVDAVEAAIRDMESDPLFNAGFGSALNADGHVEMCSAIMEGTGFNVGGVAVIMGVAHPISVARSLLHRREILLAAEGAHRFASEHGCEMCDPADLVVARGGRQPVGAYDTVGCVARDATGRMAVGTSTGGLEGCPAGRVGDAPLPGCGFYVDDAIGGVALSGHGEQIARKMLAARIIQTLDESGPDAALHAAVRHVAELDGEVGGIVLTADGHFGWEHNSQDFPVAYHSSEMASPAVFTKRDVARP